MTLTPPTPREPFVHPGLLDTAPRIATFAAAAHAGDGPASRTAALLRHNARHNHLTGVAVEDEAFWLAYPPHPYAQWDAVHWQWPGSGRDLLNDAKAFYTSVLLWCIDRDSRPQSAQLHAAKARQIINAWSSSLSGIGVAPHMPQNDHILYTRYSWPAFIWGAELLKADPHWAGEDRSRFARILREIILPAASGPPGRSPNNWYSWALCLRTSAAVYLDNFADFDLACDQWRAQLDNYVGVNLHGEMQRDLWHSQMGLAPLVAVAQIAHHQGVDLYTFRDSRLLRAIEYQIPFWLCNTQDEALRAGWPFETPVDFSTQTNGDRLWNFCSMARAHYSGHLGIPTPNLGRMMQAMVVLPDPSASPRQSTIIDAAEHRDQPILQDMRAEDFLRIGYTTLTHPG